MKGCAQQQQLRLVCPTLYYYFCLLIISFQSTFRIGRARSSGSGSDWSPDDRVQHSCAAVCWPPPVAPHSGAPTDAHTYSCTHTHKALGHRGGVVPFRTAAAAARGGRMVLVGVIGCGLAAAGCQPRQRSKKLAAIHCCPQMSTAMLAKHNIRLQLYEA